MPDNVFRISIVAVDKATAVARGVNTAFAKFTKPVTDLHKSVTALGKEAGIANLAKSATGAASAASSLAGQVRGIVTPLAAIAGIGVTASIVEMTRAWVDQGAEVARTSRILGIYANDLQSVRNVGRLFGVDTGAATGALQEFGNTVQGALYGRNQEALGMLNALHVGIVRLKNGSIDTVTMMKRVADSAQFQRANAHTKQFIASTLGLSSLLPVMLQGSAAIDAYQKRMQYLSGQTDEDRKKAEQFAQAQTELSVAFGGVGNAIGSKLIPVFLPIIKHTTDWLAANREMIGQKFDYYARRIADGIEHINWDKVESGLRSIVGGVKFVVDALGGLGNTAIAVGIALNAGLILNVIKLSGKLIELGVNTVLTGARLAAMAASALPSLALGAATALESLAGLTAGIPLVGVAMEGLSGAFVAFGVAIEATPIGWVITAIAGASYLLYVHWKEIKSLASGLWGILDKLWNAAPIRAVVSATMPLVGVAIELVKHWDAVWDILKDIGGWLADSWIGKALSWTLTDDADAFKNALAESPAVAAKVANQPVARTPGAVSSAPIANGAASSSQTNGAVVANDVFGISGNPRGIRNNNPGNLNFVGQAGATRENGSGRFAAFPTMQAGVDALNHQLKLYEGRGVNSVQGIISKFAPANENNTQGYIRSVANDLHVNPNQPLKLDPPTLAKLDRAIVSVEDGRKWADRVLGPQNDNQAPMAIAMQTPAATGQPGLSPFKLAQQATTPTLTPQAPAVAGPYSQGQAAPGGGDGAAAGQGAGGKNSAPVIMVEFKGAPPGMVASVSGAGSDKVGLKVEYAMKGAA